MSILGQLYFEPVIKDGKTITNYVGTIISFTVKKPDGTTETFESEPTVPINLQPIKYSEVQDLQLGQTVYWNDKLCKVNNKFPTDGEVWISLQHPIDGAQVRAVKYFEIRVAK